jgi:peptide/nickel transport system permease protein
MLARRLALSVPLLFVVSASVFVLMALIPGDITETILGPKESGRVPLSEYKHLAHELGIDRPLYAQYWGWLSQALHGDLGLSLLTQQSVEHTITQRFPVTLALTIGALLVSVILGVGLGLVSAVRGGAIGRAVDAVAMVGWVLPVYWVAAELVVLFAVKVRWLPATGYVPFAESPEQWLRSLLLPVFALALGPIGGFAKFTREAMLDALGSEYVRMARANGIGPAQIILGHAFKTASLQVVTLAGLLTVGLLTGTVFVEQVFALPGMGALIVGGAQGHDITMVQGVAVFFTLIIVVVMLMMDLAIAFLSPKVAAG